MPKTKARLTVTVNEEFCKGCGLCVSVCPRHALALAGRIDAHGFHPAHLEDQEGFTGCGQCALLCPDACFTITRSET